LSLRRKQESREGPVIETIHNDLVLRIGIGILFSKAEIISSIPEEKTLLLKLGGKICMTKKMFKKTGVILLNIAGTEEKMK
jgi:hypothetical protein